MLTYGYTWFTHTPRMGRHHFCTSVPGACGNNWRSQSIWDLWLIQWMQWVGSSLKPHPLWLRHSHYCIPRHSCNFLWHKDYIFNFCSNNFTIPQEGNCCFHYREVLQDLAMMTILMNTCNEKELKPPVNTTNKAGTFCVCLHIIFMHHIAGFGRYVDGGVPFSLGTENLILYNSLGITIYLYTTST